MIQLTEQHYAAIGRVAVESCTLNREVREYLTNLGSPPGVRSMIGKKLYLFEVVLGTQGLSSTALDEFTSAVQKVRKLISRRNALAHGVWVPDPTSLREFSSTASNGRVSVHASDVANVAAKLRIARKLLLRLCQDHLSVAAGQRRKISASAATLAQKL